MKQNSLEKIFHIELIIIEKDQKWRKNIKI